MRYEDLAICGVHLSLQLRAIRKHKENPEVFADQFGNVRAKTVFDI